MSSAHLITARPRLHAALLSNHLQETSSITNDTDFHNTHQTQAQTHPISRTHPPQNLHLPPLRSRSTPPPRRNSPVLPPRTARPHNALCPLPLLRPRRRRRRKPALLPDPVLLLQQLNLRPRAAHHDPCLQHPRHRPRHAPRQAHPPRLRPARSQLHAAPRQQQRQHWQRQRQ